MNIAIAWSDLLKVREKIKLVSLLGIVFAFISFAGSTVFAKLGINIMITGVSILIFGLFYVLNEKESKKLEDKLAGKIKSTFEGGKQ